MEDDLLALDASSWAAWFPMASPKERLLMGQPLVRQHCPSVSSPTYPEHGRSGHSYWTILLQNQEIRTFVKDVGSHNLDTTTKACIIQEQHIGFFGHLRYC